MHFIELILIMLLAVLFSGYLVRILPLPLPLAQIGLGAILSGVFHQGVVLDPDLFFLLFLPPLLFLDGWRIPKVGLFRDKGMILQLALGLVVFTVIGAGSLVHWMIPAMPLAVAFALAAIVSPTDPVAVSSMAARVPIPKRLMHILEGESLLNDASGLVCFRFAVLAAMTGHFSFAAASLMFAWQVLVGVSIGAGVTWGISLLQRWLTRKFGEEVGTSILASLLIPFGVYLLAEYFDASGILAAVTAGITMNYVELTGRSLATTRLHRAVVWEMLQFTLNGIMFVLLGEQLPEILEGAVTAVKASGHSNPWWLVVYTLVLSVGLKLLRLLWVWGLLRWSMLRARLRGEQPFNLGWRLVAATSLAGVRGAITLAGILTLPFALPDGTPFPARELAIFLAAAVILLSLVEASLALPWVLKGLTIADEPAGRIEEDLARTEASHAAIAAIERAHHALVEKNVADTELLTSAAMRAMEIYQHRLESGTPGVVEAEQLRKADQAELTLRLAGLKAERETIFHLARNHRISDATSRQLVREIDLQEARYL